MSKRDVFVGVIGVALFSALLYATSRKSEANITHHEFQIPTIEIHAYGGGMGTSYMQLTGCNIEEVVRILNGYNIEAKKSPGTDPDCIDILGDHPFYSLKISRAGHVEFTLPVESKISRWKLEDIAKEIYWAH